MADPVPCPRCKRPNASHRAACLYCGETMPSPTAPPSRSAPRALPSNFDDLVREALAGGNISKLRTALDEPLPPTPAPPTLLATPSASSPPRSMAAAAVAPSSVPRPAPLPSARTVPAVALRTAPKPMAAVPIDLTDALQAVVEAARNSVAVQQRGGDVRAALEAVTAAVVHAQGLSPVAPVGGHPVQLPPSLTLPPPPVPQPAAPQPAVLLPPVPLPAVLSQVNVADRPRVQLPSYNRHWMLILAGPGDAELSQPLARALGVDGITARLAAVARAPRVALRSDAPETLRAAALRVQRLGVSAVVVSRSELADIASPDVVLGVSEPGRLSVSATVSWKGEHPSESPPDLRTLPWAGLSLAVPGEVVVRRYRPGRSLARGRRQERVLRLSTEQRVQVLDLHGPGRFLRVVAGLTATEGLPGHDPSSVLRAYNGLVSGLPELLVKCRIEGDRTCAPGPAPELPDGHDGSTPIVASGWALWEEHSRLARLLVGLASDDVGVNRA